MSPILVLGLIGAGIAYVKVQEKKHAGPAPGNPLVPVYAGGKLDGRYAQFVFEPGMGKVAAIGPRYPSLYNADMGAWVWQNPNVTYKPAVKPVIH